VDGSDNKTNYPNPKANPIPSTLQPNPIHISLQSHPHYNPIPSTINPSHRYILLDAWVLPATPTAPLAVATKVILDQGLQTPVGMALFFATLKLLEGKPREVVPEVQAKVGARGLVLGGWGGGR